MHVALVTLCGLVYCLAFSAFLWKRSLSRFSTKRGRTVLVVAAHLIGIPIPYLAFACIVWICHNAATVQFDDDYRALPGTVGLFGLGCLMSALLGTIAGERRRRSDDSDSRDSDAELDS